MAWEKVGTIGVDAGVCWVGDPCYVLHQTEKPKDIGNDWLQFCDKLASPVTQFNYDHGGAGLGVVVSTGHGDGSYPVFVKRAPDGAISHVMVRFLSSREV